MLVVESDGFDLSMGGMLCETKPDHVSSLLEGYTLNQRWLFTKFELLNWNESLALKGLDHLVVRNLGSHTKDLLQQPSALGCKRVRASRDHLPRRDKLLCKLVVVFDRQLLSQGMEGSLVVAGGAALLVVGVFDEVLHSRFELRAELG